MDQTMTKRTAATLKVLAELKDVDIVLAARVRDVWLKHTREQLIAEFPKVATYVRECVNPPGTRLLRHMAVDSLIDTYGVEYLGTSRKTGEHVYYCNAGDPYVATVIFSGPRLWVGCWGDLIEHRSIKERGTL
jgi:hypothetical protein